MGLSSHPGFTSLAHPHAGVCTLAWQAEAMVAEALIGYQGQIYYDGLLKILITQ